MNIKSKLSVLLLLAPFLLVSTKLFAGPVFYIDSLSLPLQIGSSGGTATFWTTSPIDCDGATVSEVLLIFGDVSSDDNNNLPFLHYSFFLDAAQRGLQLEIWETSDLYYYSNGTCTLDLRRTSGVNYSPIKARYLEI